MPHHIGQLPCQHLAIEVHQHIVPAVYAEFLAASGIVMIGFSIAMRSKSLEGRRHQGHCTVLIDLGGELAEWCRRELGPAGFEAVHAGFQVGEIRFEGVDAFVALRK